MNPVVLGLGIVGIIEGENIYNYGKQKLAEWSAEPGQKPVVPMHPAATLVGCKGGQGKGQKPGAGGNGGQEDLPALSDDELADFNSVCQARSDALQAMIQGESNTAADAAAMLLGNDGDIYSFLASAMPVDAETEIDGMTPAEMKDADECPATLSWDESDDTDPFSGAGDVTKVSVDAWISGAFEVTVMGDVDSGELDTGLSDTGAAEVTETTAQAIDTNSASCSGR